MRFTGKHARLFEPFPHFASNISDYPARLSIIKRRDILLGAIGELSPREEDQRKIRDALSQFLRDIEAFEKNRSTDRTRPRSRAEPRVPPVPLSVTVRACCDTSFVCAAEGDSSRKLHETLAPADAFSAATRVIQRSSAAARNLKFARCRHSRRRFAASSVAN